MELWKKTWLVLKRRWPALITPLVIALGGVVAYDALVPQDHAATTTLFLRAPDVKSSASAYQGNLFTMQRATTYVNMVQSDELAQLVVDKLGLSESAHDLAEKVAAAPIRDTVIIDITVTDRDPQQAANLANTYGTEFASYVAKVEAANLEPDAPPLVTTVKAASAEDADSTTLPLALLLVLAGIPALILGVALVWLGERYDSKIRSRRQLEDLANAPVLGSLAAHRSLQTSGSVDEVFQESRAFANEVRVLSLNVQNSLRSLETQGSSVVLAVASVGVREGKSTVARSLAKALKERGRSVGVLAVGPDGVSHEQDDQRTEVFAAAKASRRDGQTRTSHAGPSERAIAAAIDDMARVEEYVIVDTGGPGSSPESQVVASLSDAVLIVVEPGRTDKNSLMDLVNGISMLGTPLIGVVANRARETNTSERFYA